MNSKSKEAINKKYYDKMIFFIIKLKLNKILISPLFINSLKIINSM